MNPQPTPAVEQIRAKAAEITARDAYDLQVRRADHTWFQDLLDEIYRWLAVPFRWIFDLTEGWPQFLRWAVILGLVALLLFLVWHILYSLARAMRDPLRGGSAPKKADRAVLKPEELERRAETARNSADYMTAVRLLFRAVVLRLEQAEEKPPRPGTTNRGLLRRYRDRPPVVDALRVFVETVDAKWYGDAPCEETDYSVCRAAYDDVRRRIGVRLPHVHSS